MIAAKRIILLLALIVACAVHASAVLSFNPENRAWEKLNQTLETHQIESSQVVQQHQETSQCSDEIASDCFLAAEAIAPMASSPGKTIELGLDDDLYNLRGTGAITYKNGGWQQAGLTSVNWGKASVDNYYFQSSFREAAGNADAIRFDVSSFDMAYPKPGVTNFELNHITSNPDLLGKTTFIQNGETVMWNGSGFGP